MLWNYTNFSKCEYGVNYKRQNLECSWGPGMGTGCSDPTKFSDFHIEGRASSFWVSVDGSRLRLQIWDSLQLGELFCTPHLWNEINAEIHACWSHILHHFPSPRITLYVTCETQILQLLKQRFSHPRTDQHSSTACFPHHGKLRKTSTCKSEIKMYLFDFRQQAFSHHWCRGFPWVPDLVNILK